VKVGLTSLTLHRPRHFEIPRRLHYIAPPSPFSPPLFLSLTSGTLMSAARTGRRPSAGRAREWAAPRC
jgi:hypothetical protein